MRRGRIGCRECAIALLARADAGCAGAIMALMGLLLLGLLIAAVPACPQGWPPQRSVPTGPADTLYYNGKIVTM